MELLQLRYFYESAKNENFSRTAEMFMVPTTSVSASIKRLEKELGCELFDRMSNRIVLNANGRILQQNLCSVFRDLGNAVEELSAHKEDNREIKILVRSMRRKITQLISQYSKKHPQVSFNISFDYKDENYENYDIIIDDEKDCYNDFEKQELFNLRLKIICSSDSNLCSKSLTLNLLCNCNFISMGFQSNMQKILDKACKRAGFSPKISVVCNDIECYEKFIESGMGIGVSRQEKWNNNKNLGISYLDVKDFNEQYTVFAYYQKKEYYGKVKSFIDFLTSTEKGI